MIADVNGVLQDPDPHDGTLDGITVSRDNTLCLKFTTVDGMTLDITMRELVRLRADNFRQGNIVFEVSLYRGRECPTSQVSRAFDYSESEAERLLSDQMNMISNQNWSMIVVEPSYGCELVAVGRGPIDVASGARGLSAAVPLSG